MEEVKDSVDYPIRKIKDVEIDRDKYPMMYDHVAEITPFTGKLVAKDDAVESLLATYEDPVVSNAVLLAPPGTGKTTLMKGLAHQDKKHVYVEAELSEMITGLRDNTEMGSVVKNLFNEIADFGKEHNIQLVIFIDEFHQLVDYSPVVAEAFKPVLAESGAKGLRLVTATTYEEFRQNIMPNQALTERLQRASLPQPRYDDVINALESLARKERIPIDRRMRELFDTIFNVTEQYMPAANQPRKSILTFSRMIGYHRAHRRKLNYELLAHVLRTGQNIEIDMRVDLDGMEEYMRTHIFDQNEAVDSFMDSVAMSVMKMNEDDKPRGSWLLLGPTGVGKALSDDTMIPTINSNGEFAMKRNGDLTIDDKVFNRKGEPVSILSVHPQGERQIYRFTFEDGRVVDASDEHLWTVYTNSEIESGVLVGKTINSVSIIDDRNTVYYVPAVELTDGFDGYNQANVHQPRMASSYVGIRNIEILDECTNMTCIYIDDDEHLYQTANGIVTHNTELVKQAAKYLFNDPNAFVRFDMTEYVNADSVDRFRQLVTARMWEYPFSILLFDEIEKANGNVVRLLMQILDDGRLVDANDRVVNFSNAYIFGTSNLGSEIFESASQYGSKSRSYERNVKKSITETSKDGGFPPELVNRFDTLVPFNPLSRETMIRLMYAKAKKILNRFYKEHNVRVNIGPRVLDQYLGYDILDDDTEAGAGRQVNRVLRDYITKPVSTYIYHNPSEREIHVELIGDTVYGNKAIIDGTARIEIVDHDTWLRDYQ